MMAEEKKDVVMDILLSTVNYQNRSRELVLMDFSMFDTFQGDASTHGSHIGPMALYDITREFMTENVSVFKQVDDYWFF
ncbi:hypothetical protein RHMOL_Rhmol04G0206400 [Rhododendron molle]|uniref:Uncharacterized protein n=1 Tax=Rhododendron molle TaxID=49168 RepID=A0ACC0P551_RHOML|nr:hypothetical protein RHMOL_Rhmol04G0206400 [Rhododendron molle]